MMRSYISAWTLVAISTVYAIVCIIDSSVARDGLITYLVVATVLAVTHIFYAHKEFRRVR